MGSKNKGEIKADFLSRMSHDIRTPLNSIMGLAALSQGALDDRDKLKYNLDQITMSCKYILSIVNNVLDMERIESGRTELNLCDFDFTLLMANVEAMMKEKAAEKKQNFSVVIGEFEDKWVMGDPIRIEQIFTTLISNAIKFTQEGGSVRLSVKEKEHYEDSICLEAVFEDTGAGVPEDFLDHMFEAASFTSKTGYTSDVDTSLSMAITKNLVEMMGGTISAESMSGRGTKITVNLNLLKQESDYENDEEDDNPLKTLSGDEYKGKRALVTEDNEMNYLIAKEFLEMTGLEVERAENGKQACDMFKQSDNNYYDVIFMDIQMPVMDGYEATRTIRAMNRLDAKTVPIIAMTASAFVSDINEAKKAGMSEHLAKPVDFDKLCAALKHWIGQ